MQSEVGGLTLSVAWRGGAGRPENRREPVLRKSKVGAS